MNKTSNTNQSFVEKGKQIYYQLKPGLDKKFSSENYVSIDVETGDYQVDKTDVGAILKSQKHHPGKKFFLAQVGRVAGLLK
jgi:hypothetical protein